MNHFNQEQIYNPDQYYHIYSEFIHQNYHYQAKLPQFDQFLINIQSFNEYQDQVATNRQSITPLQNDEIFFESQEQQIEQKLISKMQLKKKKTIKKQSSKEDNKQNKKNHYKKNIVGHIMQVIVKNIYSQKYQQQINFYCQQIGLQNIKFYNFFQKYTGSNKIGASTLHYIFVSQKCGKQISLVLGLFMIRYLKEDYVKYMVSQGRMERKQLYMERAAQLIQIPNISEKQYNLISSFKNLA